MNFDEFNSGGNDLKLYCEMEGIPFSIIERFYELLKSLNHDNSSHLIHHLNIARRELRPTVVFIDIWEDAAEIDPIFREIFDLLNGYLIDTCVEHFGDELETIAHVREWEITTLS